MNNNFSDALLCDIAQRSKVSPTCSGMLHKQCDQLKKWIEKYYTLYQNLIFEFESIDSLTPTSIFHLEHCKADRIEINNIEQIENQNTFCISNCCNNVSIELKFKANDDVSCNHWVDAINKSSYSLLKSIKDELEYRNMHLLRVIESERTAKWQLQDFTEEQRKQLESLRKEIPGMVSKKVEEALTVSHGQTETDEILKIKKIQSFVRGIICRRRWHAIVQDYIRSPHAECMRKRNRIVFLLVRVEEEYVDYLSTLVSNFYRPFKMAASSKNQLISHDEVSSIFLNSETLMFLHQIFLKGLQTRMESWPKLVLGDLFDMLLPMLSVYQEYVRNHHYSLQTLRDCKQSETFRSFLTAIESKTSCGRTLETFLTYPMHRVPRYMATIQKLLSLTPHDHVERKSLEHSQSVLEELSTVMHDEVSETENIRKNLAIERLFQNGCELLLDSSEVFIRQGVLMQLNFEIARQTRKKSNERKEFRQCFLFSKFLLITTRLSNGKLVLILKGRLELNNTTLIEDIVDEDIDLVSLPNTTDHGNLPFKLLLANKEDSSTEKFILLATSMEEKTLWTSDISQCIENLKEPDEEETVSIESRKSLLSIKSDVRLFTDSDDIKYSRALDSCRLPRIRYASVERLLERLLDVRFLSVEYLNVFLTTYSVFTDASHVLNTTIESYYARKPMKPKENSEKVVEKTRSTPEGLNKDTPYINLSAPLDPVNKNKRQTNSSRNLQPPNFNHNRRNSSPSMFTEGITDFNISVSAQEAVKNRHDKSMIKGLLSKFDPNLCHQLTDKPVSTTDDNKNINTQKSTSKDVKDNKDINGSIILTSPPKNRKEMKKLKSFKNKTEFFMKPKLSKTDSPKKFKDESRPLKDLNKNKSHQNPTLRRKLSGDCINKRKLISHRASLPTESLFNCAQDRLLLSPTTVSKIEAYRGIFSYDDITTAEPASEKVKPKNLSPNSLKSPILFDEFQRSPKSPILTPPTPGVIVTSHRSSQRRTSVSNAAVAFAVATAGANKSPVASPTSRFRSRFNFKFSDESDGHIVTKRVLNVLNHWVLKQPEIFKKSGTVLKDKMETFLLTLIQAEDTVASERKISKSILKALVSDTCLTSKLPVSTQNDIDTSNVFNISSSLHIAEQMTLIDHILLSEVLSSEFLSTGWMKEEKDQKAPHLLRAISRFNMASRLIIIEILSRATPSLRASAIAKWAMVADSCRCLHNFNGVLTIMTAFTCSAIFRLKKTWEKVSKQTRLLIEKLKTIVSSEGRFRNLREALKCCDPPCVPYLGFYLSDLAFVEESTSMLKETNLVNLSKMRMVANIIEEIHSYQVTPYKINVNEQIMAYLLRDELLNDDQIYDLSLDIEQRRPTTSSGRLFLSFRK